MTTTLPDRQEKKGEELKMQKELTGKVVLITGAARNIGRATALAFAADGATVAINALTSGAEAEGVAKEIRDAGGRAGVFLADITDAAAVKAMVEDILKQFGRIDDLVLNASFRKRVPFLEVTYEHWRRVLSIGLDGAFHCVKNCLPHMIKAGGGHIVMLGGAGALAGSPGRVETSVAKHGLIGMTRSLAKELAQYGINVNCVSPGQVQTVRAHTPIAKDIPVGRLGQPDDIADMIHYLCTSRGSYITGQVMHVNGGVLMGS